MNPKKACSKLPCEAGHGNAWPDTLSADLFVEAPQKGFARMSDHHRRANIDESRQVPYEGKVVLNGFSEAESRVENDGGGVHTEAYGGITTR